MQLNLRVLQTVALFKNYKESFGTIDIFPPLHFCLTTQQMALISDRDIFNIVAYDYLTFQDLVNLDTAVVNADERAGFMDLLRTVHYSPPCHDDHLDKWWRFYKQILPWVVRRHMFTSDGAPWHTNAKMWEELIDDTEIDYKPFMSRIKELFFEGFGGPFNLRGLHVCDSLHWLQFCNYNAPVAAQPIPTFPSLLTLVLQNTKINNITMRNFMGARNLKFINFKHVTFEAVSDEVVQHYMSKQLTNVKVLNKIPEFFQFYCGFENAIEVAGFDMLHQTGQTEFDLEPFLSKSPRLRKLVVDRMCLDIQTLFSLIVRYCPDLEYLYLNHIRIATPGSSDGKPIDFMEVPFRRLKIATMLPSTNENYEKILSMTMGKIDHLEMSYSERLTDDGYLKIRDLCPNLQHLNIDDKQEMFEGEPEREGRIERLVEYFKAVPNMRITWWPRWLSEFQKVKNASEGTLKYVRKEMN